MDFTIGWLGEFILPLDSLISLSFFIGEDLLLLGVEF
jgi:hypothetical protein